MISVMISIHAPCTGSDQVRFPNISQLIISIHAPCTGSDGCFQLFSWVYPHFNPRSLHGERPLSRVQRQAGAQISIHAPCTGSDDRAVGGRVSTMGFQSTLPARGATGMRGRKELSSGISIHAPCTGSDQVKRPNTSTGRNFNPRSLHGERRKCGFKGFCVMLFQSTLPARGATPLSRGFLIFF